MLMTKESNSDVNYKPVLLELFSGTGSVGRSFRSRGWAVFSVDIDADTNPTLVANVLDLQLYALPPRVNCIWASPPAGTASALQTPPRGFGSRVGSHGRRGHPEGPLRE